ncbi:ATP-binding protein [Amylibacter sp.]|nr:ATP-binding protein [Amylibacter sp.]MDB9892863.1 ATP-binding protein [Amylibacter sp.]
MKIEDQDEILAPSPTRLVNSLRDTGYSYQAAFADIVDNSIAAEANKILINIDQNIFGNEVIVEFYDNGHGMDESELVNAMKYGSPKRTSPKSLGKFGMGLKTASTSFCRKLTVITKKNENINLRTWDISAIEEADKWILLKPSKENYASQIDKLKNLSETSGTIVVWEDVDRLLSNSGTDFSEKALEKIVGEIKSHLSATFGKFLIGVKNFSHKNQEEKFDPDINIEVNGIQLEGWDPTGQFLNTKDNPDRTLCEETKRSVDLNFGGKSSKGNFDLNGYILPIKSSMSKEELEAVRFGNDNQGFYIYRENRLIYGGGWPHRLFSQDSHLNLVRVELNFDYKLDDYFEIDIRKTKVTFPLKLREELKKILAPWRNQAQKRYRGERKSTGGTTQPLTHGGSTQAIGGKVGPEEKVEVVSYDNDKGTIKIKNRFGEFELKRSEIVSGTDVYVMTVPSLEGNLLWNIDIDIDGRTILQLNENHEFYKRYYNSKNLNVMLIQAMDSVFWAIGNAELKSVSDKARKNLEELRLVTSNCLEKLAHELPDVEK